MSFIVAIDGPAGTGKGTIASLISKQMGLVNIDTGATYRCVALYAIRNGIKLEEKNKIIESLQDINIDMKNEDGVQKVYLNGEDVSTEIRSKEVTAIVSQVSSIVEVREKLVDIQRKLAKGNDVIMEGRDITTVVFPNADVKIYMDADENERAKRRYKEMIEKGMNTTFEEVLQNIQARDKNDKEKEVGALKIVEDAIVVDTTNKSIKEVNKEIKKIIINKQKEIEHRKMVYTPRPDTKWKRFVYIVTKATLSLIYKIIYRVKKIGEDNIEEGCPYILCANHTNALDAVGMALFTKRKIFFVGKEELCNVRFFNWLAHLFDCIPVRRNAQDVESMKRCLKVLKENGILGIFPEGTRNGMAKGAEVKNGAAFMALRTGAKVIPVGVKGNFKPFTKLIFNYGKPLDFSMYDKNDKEALDKITKEIMDNIIELSK